MNYKPKSNKQKLKVFKKILIKLKKIINIPIFRIIIIPITSGFLFGFSIPGILTESLWWIIFCIPFVLFMLYTIYSLIKLEIKRKEIIKHMKKLEE